ncbi:MAG: hypothetical protein JST55_11605 [Bacteroidetes bacterium]|nr:hypothetical protein [Bacteroidota bacterium]
MKIIFALTLLVLLTNTSFAQHHHHDDDTTKTKKDTMDMKMPNETPENMSDSNKHDHSKMNMDGEMNMSDSTMNSFMNSSENPSMNNHDMHLHGNMDDMAMSHSYSLSLPMNRNGSGTGWLPDASPMYGYMVHSNNWMLMFHGGVFLRYTSTNINNEGKGGASMFDAPNWFMGMAQRKIGADGLIKFGLMMSLDRLTERGDGYPLLFQSGETWQGNPLVNRQHPHDLFSELSIAYTQRLSKDVDVTGYFGYPGEPALGPVAFMHRVSAGNNPDAPLSHHWQDATHITFGVGTFGVRYNIFKIEGSIFNGKEPDENRYNFDKGEFNSYSYRVSVNPDRNFALQFSQGFIKAPEALEPEVDVTRTTASVTHSYNFTKTSNLNTTIAWGMNDKKSGEGDNHKEHSLLLESNYEINKANLYGRYEFVEKDAEELALSGFEHGRKFSINAFTLGTNYKIGNAVGADVSLGLQGSLYFIPSDLETYYGKNPVSAQIYLKLSPMLMK